MGNSAKQIAANMEWMGFRTDSRMFFSCGCPIAQYLKVALGVKYVVVTNRKIIICGDNDTLELVPSLAVQKFIRLHDDGKFPFLLEVV